MRYVEGKNSRKIRSSVFAAPLLVALIVSSSYLYGCSSTPSVSDNRQLSTPIVWPLPPAEPIIEYSRSLSSSSDIKGKGGLFRGLVDLIFGKHEERIVKPYGIAVDSTRRVIIADTALKRLHIFDEENKKYSWVDKAKKSLFVSPVGVATDREDNIYVSDSELAKVFKLDNEGKLVSIIQGDFLRPTGLAVDKNEGILYVVDTWEHAVKAFNLEGGYLFTFGGRGVTDGKFNYPTNVHVDREGTVYVTDSMNFRVQIFERDGKFITQFGNHGDGSGDFARPKGVGVDGEGHIYVVDALFDVVQIFDRRGNYLFAFGGSGQGRGMFWLPGGLFIDEENTIYVADSYNKRVQVFRFLGADLMES